MSSEATTSTTSTTSTTDELLPRLGLISFVVFTTGPHLGLKDKVKSVAIVSCDHDDPVASMKTSLISLDFEKPEGCSWKELFLQRGFTKEPVLMKYIQDPKTAQLCSEDDLPHKIDEALKFHEERFQRTILVQDSLHHTIAALGHLMFKGGCQPLHFTRAGVHRTAVHVSSYINAIAGVVDPDDEETIKQFITKELDPLLLEPFSNDLTPVSGAKYILFLYLAALQYMKNLNSSSSSSPTKRPREA